MNSKTKDTLRALVEQHIAYLAQTARSGTEFTDGEHTAVAMHALAFQMSEAAAALGRIYMALEKANQLDEQCVN